MRRVERSEQGSMLVMMMVILVVTGLIVALLFSVEQGLRTSRRAGDSANALQVADAAVNDALQAIPTAQPTPTAAGLAFTRSAVLGQETWPGFCPEAKDCYTYTATRDPGQRLAWNIDATGTDRTGARRRIRATAVATSLFNSPLFVKSTMNLSSGVLLDSYSSGATKASMCTKNGVIGTNSPSGMTFGTQGQGEGVINCQNWAYANNWSYAMDGCTSFGTGTQALPPINTAQCPPEPATFRTNTGLFSPPGVSEPKSASVCEAGDPHGSCVTTATNGQTPVTCPSSQLPSLVGGSTYYFSSVTLLDGCRVTNPKVRGDGRIDIERPVVIYAATNITIGDNGSNQRINEPPSIPGQILSICGSATAISTQNDRNGDPPRYYCPAWTASLRLRVLDGTGSGEIKFRGNGTRFWGAMEAPNGAVRLDGSQIKVWGAVVSDIAASNAQFSWHFDDALTAVSTTQFTLANWREEPLS